MSVSNYTSPFPKMLDISFNIGGNRKQDVKMLSNSQPTVWRSQLQSDHEGHSTVERVFSTVLASSRICPWWSLTFLWSFVQPWRPSLPTLSTQLFFCCLSKISRSCFCRKLINASLPMWHQIFFPWTSVFKSGSTELQELQWHGLSGG